MKKYKLTAKAKEFYSNLFYLLLAIEFIYFVYLFGIFVEIIQNY